MPTPPKYLPWSQPNLDKLHHLFLQGDDLHELSTQLKRPNEDIIRALNQLNLLTIRNGYYYRVHPTPFAETKAHHSKSEVPSS